MCRYQRRGIGVETLGSTNCDERTCKGQWDYRTLEPQPTGVTRTDAHDDGKFLVWAHSTRKRNRIEGC